MNQVIAYKLLTAELAPYRQLSLAEISKLAGEKTTLLLRGEDNNFYSVRYGCAGSRQMNDEFEFAGWLVTRTGAGDSSRWTKRFS